MLHTNASACSPIARPHYGVNQLAHRATRQNLFFDFNGDGRLDLASIALTKAGLSAHSRESTPSDRRRRWPALRTDSGRTSTDIDPSPGLELLCAPRNGTLSRRSMRFRNGNVRNVTASYAQFATVIDAATLDFNRDLRPDLFIMRGSERASDAYQFASGRFEAQFITAANKTKSVTFKTTGHR